MSDEKLKEIIIQADDNLERVKDRCHDLYEENKRLKTKIEKAVEYIKNNWYSKSTIDIDRVVIGDWHIDLLNILQNGSDNE